MSEFFLAKELQAYYASSKGFIRAVDSVTLNLNNGDVLGIAGESGCGKSTLSNVLIMNIRPPLKLIGGKVVLAGKDLTSLTSAQLKAQIWGRAVALVPQSALNALIPTRKIRNLVNDVLTFHQPLNKKQALKLAVERFREIGLSKEVLAKYPHQLSGGMRQRVVIGIATLLRPKLLIADEPTSALDVSTQKQVLRMLLKLHSENIVNAMIIITHDIAVLRQIATKVAIMYAGKIVETALAEQFFQAPVHPYAFGLLHSAVTPEPELRERGLSHIPGEPPDLIRPPSGCRFHPRCSQFQPICASREPPLVLIDKDHAVVCHFAAKRLLC